MKVFAILLIVLSSLHAVAALFEVGPKKAHENIGDVAWESLQAGDTVLIYHRAQPYHEKWVICRQGTEQNKIVIRGVPDSFGRLPVISGSNASTRIQLDYWNENRSIIKIGGASIPPDTMPRHITIENLEIQSGRPPYGYINDHGSSESYIQNAAAVFVEKGEHITLRNCVFHDCGNGLFTSWQSTNLVVENCRIYDNGNVGSAFEHNSYTESFGILFQYNHYGPLRPGCDGNNLKDRSMGCVIRHNWIESGNRQLDLVDSDHSAIYNAPEYRSTYVYGNILIEPDGAGNSQICHYGGDSGTTTRYRKGTLYFYNNTVVSTRGGNTTLFRLSTNEETVDCRNNIFYVTSSGSRLAVLNDEGTVNLFHNWLKENWTFSHSNPSANVNDFAGTVTGSDPGFENVANQLFSLVSTSVCLNAGTVPTVAVLPDHDVTQEYVKHRQRQIRRFDGSLDLGAYEQTLDSDADFIPDWWEYSYFGGITNAGPALDADIDGLSNLEEYVADTVPTNGNSVFLITEFSFDEPGLSVSITSSSNRVYALQSWVVGEESDVWSNLTGEVTGQHPTMMLSTVEETDNSFYRVLVKEP